MSKIRPVIVTLGAVEGSDVAAFEGAVLPALSGEPQLRDGAVDVRVGDFPVGVPLTSPILLMRLLVEYQDRPLPNHLFAALHANLRRQIPKDRFQRNESHLERWALMHYALDTLHKRWEQEEAQRWCAQQLRRRGRPASAATVLRSYRLIEKEQRALGRGRPRTYRPRTFFKKP
jgi:hypothetical protein